jgi:Cu+-exporting ATPase
MHREIVQDRPGNCPKCGMTLEQRTVNAEEQNDELIDMTRRIWVSTALALPLFVLAMVADLAPGWLPDGISIRTLQWIEFALITPLVVWGGWPFFVRAGAPTRPSNCSSDWPQHRPTVRDDGTEVDVGVHMA